MSEWINPIGITTDAEVKGVPSYVGYGIRCGACGEFVELNEWEARYTTFKLCPECIKAIKWARLQMKSCNMNIEDDIK